MAYFVDKKETNWQDIIEQAEAYDEDFGSDGLCTTSEAARILRNNGHTVTDKV